MTIKRRAVKSAAQAGVPTASHYTVIRLPSMPPDNTGKGALDWTVQVVCDGAVTTKCDAHAILDQLRMRDHWFITKKPGLYAIIGFLASQSMTFYVDKNGAYHPGFVQFRKDSLDEHAENAKRQRERRGGSDADKT